MKINKKKLLIVVLFVGYVLLYFLISRNSLEINKKYGVNGFYYVPLCSPEQFARSPSFQILHEVGIVMFYPIWFVDHVFNGPEYERYACFVLNAPANSKLNSPRQP